MYVFSISSITPLFRLVYYTYMSLGIIYALLALIGWAFDDFFIGRTSKKIGTLPALFLLACFGVLVLSPFAIPALPAHVPLSSASMGILLALMIATSLAALADFEALRTGKLATIDPLYGFEIPLTSILAYVFLGDTLSWLQMCFIAFVLGGMLLVSVSSFRNVKSLRWERGVHFALLSVVFMGATNFLTGYTARAFTPILANWFSYLGLALFCLILLVRSRRLSETIHAAKTHVVLIIALGTADVIAWTSFAYSTTHIPIGITTAISEAYIALAVLLGVYLNKERLRTHQWLGIAIIIVTITALALSTT